MLFMSKRNEVKRWSALHITERQRQRRLSDSTIQWSMCYNILAIYIQYLNPCKSHKFNLSCIFFEAHKVRVRHDADTQEPANDACRLWGLGKLHDHRWEEDQVSHVHLTLVIRSTFCLVIPDCTLTSVLLR